MCGPPPGGAPAQRRRRSTRRAVRRAVRRATLRDPNMSTSVLLVPVLPGHVVLANAVSRACCSFASGSSASPRVSGPGLIDCQGVTHADGVAFPQSLQFLDDSAVKIRMPESEHTQLDRSDCHVCYLPSTYSRRMPRGGAAADQPCAQPHHADCGVPHPGRVKAASAPQCWHRLALGPALSWTPQNPQPLVLIFRGRDSRRVRPRPGARCSCKHSPASKPSRPRLTTPRHPSDPGNPS